MTTKLRPTTTALMLATLLRERYCGPNAPDTHLSGEATVNALPVPNPDHKPVDVGSTETHVQNPRYLDVEFDNLIKVLTDMDARTGRPDPSKRPRKTVRARKVGPRV